MLALMGGVDWIMSTCEGELVFCSVFSPQTGAEKWSPVKVAQLQSS